MNTFDSNSGFSVIELIIAIVIFSLFCFGLFEGYILFQSQSVLVDRQARASNFAYTNLYKVTTRPASVTQAVCNANAANMDLTVGSLSTEPGLDITQYGYTLEPSATVTQALGSDATQTLVAYAPNGCTNIATSPLEIVATVTFGGTKVSHASYVQ